MNSKKLTDILLYFSIAVFIFGAGYKLGEYQTKNTSSSFKLPFSSSSQRQVSSIPPKEFDFDLFWDTWTKMEQKYIDEQKVDPKKMFYGAIKGMVASAEDPYTFFLTPEENRQSKDDLGGKFEGIGAQLGLRENRVTVIAPLKNSPAEKAGVKPGDFIIAVDDQSIKGWTLPQTVSKIRGEKGTEVKLTLQRDSKEIKVAIIRDQIYVASVELEYETINGQKVAHARINQFGDDTNKEWSKASDEISEKYRNGEIAGMVLDLRDNPGGYLESSVFIASDFIPEGKIVVKQEVSTGDNRVYESMRAGQLLNIPVTVLINEGSASASEILAGALRDHKRAILIGQKSFGKGSVQEALDLKDGAGLHVTIAKWILPNGDWINGKGIEPAVTVENKIPEGNTITKQTDKQLQTALEEVIKRK